MMKNKADTFFLQVLEVFCLAGVIHIYIMAWIPLWHQKEIICLSLFAQFEGNKRHEWALNGGCELKSTYWRGFSPFLCLRERFFPVMSLCFCHLCCPRSVLLTCRWLSLRIWFFCGCLRLNPCVLVFFMLETLRVFVFYYTVTTPKKTIRFVNSFLVSLHCSFNSTRVFFFVKKCQSMPRYLQKQNILAHVDESAINIQVSSKYTFLFRRAKNGIFFAGEYSWFINDWSTHQVRPDSKSNTTTGAGAAQIPFS